MAIEHLKNIILGIRLKRLSAQFLILDFFGKEDEPMKIIRGSVSDTIDKSDSGDLAYWLEPWSLFTIIRKSTWMLGAIMCVCILISMMYIDKAEKLADKKQDLIHKLLIIFLITALISIMNFLYAFFSNVA